MQIEIKTHFEMSLPKRAAGGIWHQATSGNFWRGISCQPWNRGMSGWHFSLGGGISWKPGYNALFGGIAGGFRWNVKKSNCYYYYYYYYYHYYPLHFYEIPLLMFFLLVRSIIERKWDYLGNYCISLVLRVLIFNSRALDLINPLYFSK